MAMPSRMSEPTATQAKGSTWTIPFVMVLSLAPLIGRLGPFLYIPSICAATGPRRQAHSGLGAFALLACLYFAYLAVPALSIHPLGAVKGMIREAAHFVLPVLVASLIARWLRPLDVALLYKSTVAGVIATALVATIERFGFGAVRAEVLTSNPIYLSAGLLYSVALIICLMGDRSRRWRIAGFVAILLAAGVIGILAQSRASFFVLAAALMIKVTSVILRHGLRSLGGLVPLIGLIIALAGFAYMASSTIYLRYSALLSIPEQFEIVIEGGEGQPTKDVVDRSTQMRVAMIVAGYRAFKEAPIFGHGLAERYKAAMPHMPPEIAGKGNFHHLHNDLLSQAVAGGLIGLAIYLALVFYPAYRAWRTGRLRTWQGDLAVMTSLVSFGVGMGNTLLFADLPAYLFALNSVSVLLLLADAETTADAPR